MKVVISLLLTGILLLSLVSANLYGSADLDSNVQVDADAVRVNAKANSSSNASLNSNGSQGFVNANIDSGLKVGLDKTLAVSQIRSETKVNLSNGKQATVKVMPSTASETAIARLKLRVCSAENNCTIILKETGNEEAKLNYEVEADKKAKILGLINTKVKAKVVVDAETGEVVAVKKPWWATLSSE